MVSYGYFYLIIIIEKLRLFRSQFENVKEPWWCKETYTVSDFSDKPPVKTYTIDL